MTAGVERNGREYSVQEIAEERRYQEQCFLLYWLTYLSTENRHINYAGSIPQVEGDENIEGAFYAIEGDPETMVSVLTGKQGIRPLFDLTPYKLSFLVPKVRLYKVFKKNQDSPSDATEYDVEFIFPDNIMGVTQHAHAAGDSTESASHAYSMLMNRVGRGTGVGINEFSWEYQGTNPAEATNRLLANISLTFTDLQELFVKRGPVTLDSHIKAGKAVNGHPKDADGADIDVHYRFVDLIMRTSEAQAAEGQGNTQTVAEEACKNYRRWDPSYYEIKALVGWSFKSGHPFTAEEIGALEAGNIGLYLTLVDHTIGYNEDGTVNLNCTYRAAVEGMLDSDFCDLFTSPYERRRSAEIDAAITALNTGEEQDVDDGSRQTGEAGSYARSSTSNASSQGEDEVRTRQVNVLRQEQTRLRNSARGIGYHTLARWLSSGDQEASGPYSRTKAEYAPLAPSDSSGYVEGSMRVKYILAKPAGVGAAVDERDANDSSSEADWGADSVATDPATYGTSGTRPRGADESGGSVTAEYNNSTRPEDWGQPTSLVKFLRAANREHIEGSGGATDGSPSPQNQVGFIFPQTMGAIPDADGSGTEVLKFAGGNPPSALSDIEEGRSQDFIRTTHDLQRQQVGQSGNTVTGGEQLEDAFYAAAVTRLDMQMTRPIRLQFGEGDEAVFRTVYPISFVYYGDLLDWAVKKSLWRAPFDPSGQYTPTSGASTVGLSSNPNAAPNSFQQAAGGETVRQSGFTGTEVDDPVAALEEYLATAENTKAALDNIEIILGSLRFYDMLLEEYTTVNIADIPISYNLFATWFMNRIMRPGVYEYSLRSFIKDSLESLVLDVLAGTNCIAQPSSNPAPISRSVYDVGILNFQAPKIASEGEVPKGPMRRVWELAASKNLFNPNEQTDGANINRYKYRLNIADVPALVAELGYEHGMYHMNEDYVGDMATYYVIYAKGYDVLSLRGVETREEAEALFPDEQDAEKYADNERGIYHLYIGQNSGMLKSIRFNRTDQAYLAESRLMAGGHFGYGQLRGRYEANIIMHGNTAFLPGQMIYINPTSVGSGDMSDREIDALMLGLGGYYVVLSVENSISEETYETRIHAVWHGMGSYYDPAANDNEGGWMILNCGESGESQVNEMTAQSAAELATRAAEHEYPDGADELYETEPRATGDTVTRSDNLTGPLSGEVEEP